MLNRRISNGAGRENSWARTCLVNYYARLHEGEEAYQHLQQNYRLLRWFNMGKDFNGFQKKIDALGNTSPASNFKHKREDL